MTRVAAVVMAHPKRRQWAEDLADRLDCPIVWDRHNDRIETGLRALQAYDRTATHHLVVQDDAIVCQDLIAGLEQAVEVSRDRIVNLYIGRGRSVSAFRINQLAARADEQKASWISWRGTIWGPGILYPVDRIEDLTRSYRRDPSLGYDSRVQSAARKRSITWLYTWPSLVDHRDWPDNPSLANDGVPGTAKPGRVARRFIGEDVSALSVDWNAGVYRC